MLIIENSSIIIIKQFVIKKETYKVPDTNINFDDLKQNKISSKYPTRNLDKVASLDIIQNKIKFIMSTSLKIWVIKLA